MGFYLPKHHPKLKNAVRLCEYYGRQACTTFSFVAPRFKRHGCVLARPVELQEHRGEFWWVELDIVGENHVVCGRTFHDAVGRAIAFMKFRVELWHQHEIPTSYQIRQRCYLKDEAPEPDDDYRL